MRRLLLPVLALALAACSGLPTASKVTVVDDVAINPVLDSVRVIVRPPRPGLSPAEIAQGFVAANAAADGDFEVARQYLEAEADRNWQPERIKVYDPVSLEFTVTGQYSVLVKYTEVGELAADHTLRIWESAVDVVVPLTLAAGGDVYRVANPPEFALMSLTDLQRNYASRIAYFLNDQYSRLVPSAVWLPRGEGATNTRLMRILLAGPTGERSLALRTAIPEGTRLTIAAVTSVGGVVSVSLNSNALQTSASQRQAMLAQIVWTLVGPDGAVSVQVGAQNLAPDGESRLTRGMFAAFDPDVPSPSADVFGLYEGDLLVGPLGDLAALRAIDGAETIAVSQDGKRVAFLRNNRAWQVRADAFTGEEQVATGIRSIAYDAADRLWLVNNRGRLLVRVPGGRTRSVAGLDGLNVVRLSPSPDLSRLAVIVSSPLGNQLRLVPVTTTGGEVGLGSPERVERYFADVADVDWQSSLELVVLGRVGVESPRVYTLGLGALLPVSVGGPNSFVRVAAAPGRAPLGVTGAGQVWTLTNGQWRFATSLAAADYAG